jgi:hypothetical protein
MKGIIGIQNSLTEIVSILDEAGFQDISSDVKSKQTELDDSSNQLKVLKELEGMFHIKALGDLNVPNSNGWNWPNKVGKVGSKCRRVINQIEKGT